MDATEPTVAVHTLIDHRDMIADQPERSTTRPLAPDLPDLFPTSLVALGGLADPLDAAGEEHVVRVATLPTAGS